MGLTNLIGAFDLLGLTPHNATSSDINFDAIAAKTTNPEIAISLGADKSVEFIRKMELCANLLDSFSASQNSAYLIAAQQLYDEVLQSLPPVVREMVATTVAAIFNYFSYERVMAFRLKRGDQFAYAELIEHLLRRGSDSLLYAMILVELDGIKEPGITAGLRLRQALWDLWDDLVDLEMDLVTKEVNLLLLARMDYRLLRQLADGLFQQAKLLHIPVALMQAIEREYVRILDELSRVV